MRRVVHINFNSKLTNVNLVVNSNLPMGRGASHMSLLIRLVNINNKNKIFLTYGPNKIIFSMPNSPSYSN